MPLPDSLTRDRWTERTARRILPLIIWCAKNGRMITYGQLDEEIVNRGWGHHVIAVQYGYPAGAIGSALIETEEVWEEPIPPLNALIVNARTRLPGRGVNYYLERYGFEQSIDNMPMDDRRAIIEEIHADIFAYKYWDDLLKEYELPAFKEGKNLYPDEINDLGIITEGARTTVTVNRYERDAGARQVCIKQHGVTCSVCQFNFEEVYGEHGAGFIHVHHITPLNEIRNEYELDPENDLIPLCPNCHAMIHRRNPALSIEQLKELIRKKC